jgi:YHS domain-containing protein
MRGIVSLIMTLWLTGMALMIVSCADKEKRTGEVNKSGVGNLNSPAISKQTTDILSGKPVSWNVFTDYKGKRIYFCCGESRKRFLLDPDRYMADFRRQGIILEDAPQGG